LLPEQLELYPQLETLDFWDDLAERLEDHPELVNILSEGAFASGYRSVAELMAQTGVNHQSGISSATRFSPGDASNGWFRMLPNNDVYFVKTRNTGSGRVEVHTATRASSYQSGISSAAPRFSPADASNGWFGLLG